MNRPAMIMATLAAPPCNAQPKIEISTEREAKIYRKRLTFTILTWVLFYGHEYIPSTTRGTSVIEWHGIRP